MIYKKLLKLITIIHRRSQGEIVVTFFGLIHSTTGKMCLKNYEVSDLTGNSGLHFRPILNPGLMQVLSETLELGLIVLSAFVWLLVSRNWAVFVRIWNTRL